MDVCLFNKVTFQEDQGAVVIWKKQNTLAVFISFLGSSIITLFALTVAE